MEMRSAASYKSWARGQCFTSSSSDYINGTNDGGSNNENSTFNPTERCRIFDTIGYIHLPQFVSSDVVASMKSTMEQLVNDEWMPSAAAAAAASPSSSSSSETATAATSSSTSGVETFRTDDKQVDAQGRSDYFLDSATKIHYFAEPYAVEQQQPDNDSSGKITVSYTHLTLPTKA